MLKAFERFILKNSLIKKGDRVLLAVSGGLDSMVLVHLFCQLKFPFAVAHVNFQLRGAESDGDEEFVRAQCSKNGVAFYSQRVDTKNYAIQNQLSIQMAARDLRYAWFRQLAVENSFSSVATAHHQSDSAETVLLKLVHGGGLESLQGVPVQSRNVIRPLLFATREQVENYAADEQLVWREDRSNYTDDYERNFLRHNVVPVLRTLNPSLEVTMAAVSQKAKLQGALLHRFTEQWKIQHVKKVENGWRIDKGSIKDEPLAPLLLEGALKDFGFNFSQCESLVSAIDGQVGKLFYSRSHVVAVDRDCILISVSPEEVPNLVVTEREGTCFNGSVHLNFELKLKWDEFNEPTAANLDADRVTFPLVWRPWRDGDRFQPLGMDHFKKVSDFLIDQKISRLEKERVTVLESAGEIIWVVGMRIDQRVRVRPETKEILSIRQLK